MIRLLLLGTALFLLQSCQLENGSEVQGVYRLSTLDSTVYQLSLVTAVDDATYGRLSTTDGEKQYNMYLDSLSADTMYLRTQYGGNELAIARAANSGTGTLHDTALSFTVQKSPSKLPEDLSLSAELQPLPLPGFRQSWPAFRTDGGFYYVAFATANGFDDRQICLSRELSDGSWDQQILSYDQDIYRFNAVGLSPNERTLVATGARTDDQGRGGANVYLLHLADPTTIDSIERLPNTINTDSYEVFADYAPDGSILYASGSTAGGRSLGKSDLFRAIPRDTGYQIQHFPRGVNTSNSDSGPSMSPDGEQLFYYRKNPDIDMPHTLFVSKRNEQGWGVGQRLPAPINLEHLGGYGIRMDKAGEFIYWTAHWRGRGHLYRYPVADIGILNP